MTSNARLFMCLFIFIVTANHAVENKIYKWTDSEGKVHYSQYPPRHDIETTDTSEMQIKTATPSPAHKTDPTTWMQKVDEHIQAQQTRKQRLSQDSTIREKRKQDCEIAKENLKVLHSHRRLTIRDAEGNETSIQTDEQKQLKIVETQEQIKALC